VARHYDSKELRETIAALDDADVPAKEIHRRLHAGEAGLKSGSIGIGIRRVYELRREHRDAKEPDEDATVQSVAALEDRAVTLLAREIGALERKRAGTLSAQDLKKLNMAHQTLISVRNRSRGRDRSKSPGNGKPQTPERRRSALEELAAELAAGIAKKEAEKEAEKEPGAMTREQEASSGSVGTASATLEELAAEMNERRLDGESLRVGPRRP
jgi:hypothetical protein